MEKDWDCEVNECKCPCHEDEDTTPREPWTKGQVRAAWLISYLVFQAAFVFFGACYAGAASSAPSRTAKYSIQGEWVERDACNTRGKWDFVIPGFTVGCRAWRWMADE